MKKTLSIQVALIALCILTIALWSKSFPYPSPLIKPFLAPKQRFPPAQIVHWVHTGTFPDDFLEFFGRDPNRITPLGNNLVSPADGFVRETLTKDGITYLMIQLTFWDVHVVRTPIAGIVKSIEEEGITLFRKDPLNVMMLRGKVAPVQKIITLDTEIGEVKIRLIANYWASRLKVWVGHGEKLKKGQRLGRMIAGSTVVAEFPGNIEFSVKHNQQVYGGETVISEGASVK